MSADWEEDQLALFGGAYTPKSGDRVGPAPVEERVRKLAARLPVDLRMGTSSWSFPGWKDIVWDREVSESVLARRGLPAYSSHPLLRSVGVDRSYYAPMKVEELRAYADAVPDDFRFLVKAHEWCTTARFPMHSRYRERSGLRNKDYLEPGYARDAVVGPFMEGLGKKGGVLLFQFPPQDTTLAAGPRGFPDRIHRFFSALPKGPIYAVEVRNPDLMTRDYQAALADVGATHCLNALPGMQDLAIQYNQSGAHNRRALVIRWMLNKRLDYQGAKQRYAPFSRIVDEDPTTREDVARLCARTRRPCFLIVNNKAEGSSPLSILRVAERIGALLEA